MELRDGSRRLAGAVAVMSIMTLAFASSARAAQAPVNLGTTASYAVLAGTTVTNTGPTLVTGNLGLSPGSAVTGFPPGLVTGGVQNVANAQAVQAQSDLVTAYNDAAGRTPATTMLGDSLGGLTLVAGLYSGGALDLTGTLTLDAQGDPGAVFIFQAASTLITASASRVAMINGASAVQRLLAGRKLGHARHHHDLQGDDPRPHVDRAELRRHGGRPAARPQRRGDAGRQHDRRFRLRARAPGAFGDHDRHAGAQPGPRRHHERLRCRGHRRP